MCQYVQQRAKDIGHATLKTMHKHAKWLREKEFHHKHIILTVYMVQSNPPITISISHFKANYLTQHKITDINKWNQTKPKFGSNWLSTGKYHYLLVWNVAFWVVTLCNLTVGYQWFTIFTIAPHWALSWAR